MFTKLLTLCVLFVSALCLSIGTVSEQNVTKRETNAADLFPDWVPFKNKHGDELGEFVQVPKKNKVKKRLALPFNFLIRAVAEPEGDDYYDKSPGESDNEDYYEKKEWSDLQRSAKKLNDKEVNIEHSDISDIDGVVEIITKRPSSVILDAIHQPRSFAKQETTVTPKIKEIDYSETEDSEPFQVPLIIKAKEKEEITENKSEDENEGNHEETSEKSKKKIKKDGEGHEETTEKTKSRNTEKDLENEKKKAKILSSVDELKERHAEEQRELSERVKGEDLYRNEFGKRKTPEELPDRFSGETTDKPNRKKNGRKLSTKPDYDEYEEFNSLEDKYKIHVLKNKTPASTIQYPRKIVTTTERVKKGKRIETGKLSVFKNPELYIIDDDIESSTTPSTNATTTTKNRGQQKFSSRYTTEDTRNVDERISLVAVEAKDGEPTLFFPKPKKNRRKKARTSTTTAATDSFVAETITDNYKQTTAVGATEITPVKGTVDAADTTVGATRTSTGYDTTGTDALFTNTDVITDAIPAPSEHKKEKNEDYSTERGGSREHTSEYSEDHEEHGKKAYEGHHEDKKTAKGFHDKENHLGKYDDKGGVDKHHSEESDHYGGHHHEEHGKKHAKYEESGKHSKGHSTKGSHDIHKKEEYEKNIEFFEEDGDSAEEEKHGGYNEEKGHSEGGQFKRGNLKAAHQQHSMGESGHFNKGGHLHTDKGHKQAAGHDSHGKNDQRHYQKAGKNGGSKWVYHHGSPAKNANLVVIDRRGDQYYHGPHYYG